MSGGKSSDLASITISPFTKTETKCLANVEIPKVQFAPSPHLGPLSFFSFPYVVLKLSTSFKSFIRKARWSTRRDQSLQLCIPCEILTSFSEPRRCTYSPLRQKRDVWRRLGADVYYHFF
jgi:hypothetical protein